MKAALVLFAERGYDGTTVPMIAESAEVGAGTIYRYFENKESLVNGLFQHCVEEFTETLKFEAIHSTPDIREQFHYVFQRLIQYADYDVNALLFIESHSSAYYLDDKSKKMFEELLGTVRQVLENGKQAGVIKDFITDALIAIVYGAFVLTFKLIKDGVLTETPELLQGLEESCWNAIRVI
ncbi:TetR/AcrR family transcriptional regulator [Paenibacillus sp. HN-1]|uniref:TetR/AcrR family transcriptional regulator n=1 Tax=Paenibacillus TaxID=44249 RepID=UPI001CA87A33|nr:MULTISPECIES: TetR/AcrR family transcriptional regulator [Paenibacillus]MBY9079945.1 TetR/AcrR family transcriptional regulator [Paenibacillus sp. CGMCC 1.18879]MBY9084587.1 TetR/AcrR family transcriptional regulator [Paenibacillus sinensis]